LVDSSLEVHPLISSLDETCPYAPDYSVEINLEVNKASLLVEGGHHHYCSVDTTIVGLEGDQLNSMVDEMEGILVLPESMVLVRTTE
jgi:hypothetical protein